MHVVFSPSCLQKFLTTTNASNATVMINIDIYVEVYTYMNVSVCELVNMRHLLWTLGRLSSKFSPFTCIRSQVDLPHQRWRTRRQIVAKKSCMSHSELHRFGMITNPSRFFTLLLAITFGLTSYQWAEPWSNIILSCPNITCLYQFLPDRCS